MEKNQILITSGTDYKRMTKELLERTDLKSHIKDRDKKIGIKPNLVSPSEASWGATTHPEVVAGIIEYLKEHGFRNLVMMEGSWVGVRQGKLLKCVDMTGLKRSIRFRSGICRRIRVFLWTAAVWN